MQKHSTKDDAYKCDHFSQLVLFFSAENSLEIFSLVNATIDFDRCRSGILIDVTQFCFVFFKLKCS